MSLYISDEDMNKVCDEDTICVEGILYEIIDDTTCKVYNTCVPFQHRSEMSIQECVTFKDGKERIPVLINHRAFFGSTCKKVELPKNIQEIGEGAFLCSHIKEVVISESVKKIGSHAFAESDVENVCIVSPDIDMGNYIFKNCLHLVDVDIKKIPRSIPIGMFEGCFFLETIEFPEHLVEIDKDAFKCCVRLTSIPNYTNIKIGLDAFKCTQIEDVFNTESNLIRFARDRMPESMKDCSVSEVIKYVNNLYN